MDTVLNEALEEISAVAEGITVRHMGFEFNDDIPEFWFNGDVFMTMVMLAMSVSFPPGERYFIDSVRHYQKHIRNPKLKQQIKAFIGQEANHSMEHTAFNRYMDSFGYPATGMENFVRKRIAQVQSANSPAENLAATAALEHFTAILAGSMLQHLDTFATMHPTVARMWVWHAIEEIEHRSVAFDVFQEQLDDVALRRSAMVRMTALFVIVNTIRTWILMYKSKHLFNLKSWVKGVRTMWGKNGLLRGVLPHYLAYYRKDFHPSQLDFSEVVTTAKRELLAPNTSSDAK